MSINRTAFRLFASASLINKSKPNLRRLLLPIYRYKSIQIRTSKPLKSWLGITMATAAAAAATSTGLSVEEQKVIKQADELFDNNQWNALEQLLDKPELQVNSANRSEFEWRLARCWYQQIKEKQRPDQDIEKAKDLVLLALEHNPENGPAHKWAAILVDAAAAAKGTKERIKQLLTVKGHMEKAIRYNPTDPTSYYLLGEWHFSCYNVSWAERQIAKVIFGTLPTPDLEEALSMFQKAEEIDPGFYSRNLLLMAKTLRALKREPNLAKECLQTLIEKYGSSNKWDDVEAVKEAKSLL